MNDQLEAAANELEQHSHVDRVRREPDGLEDVVFVILDWVTDSHRSSSGARIINDVEYDGHIKKVGNAISDMDGVRRTRTLDTRMHGQTWVIEPTRGDA